MVACVGTVETGCEATPDAVRRDGAGTADSERRAAGVVDGPVRTGSATLRSVLEPDHWATTSPVTSAVTTTRAIPMAVSFHGLFQSIPAITHPSLRSLGPSPSLTDHQIDRFRAIPMPERQG